MKLVLCVPIVLICAAIGRQLAGRMAQRLAFFREYQCAVTFLSDKVVGLGLELGKALCACHSGSLKPLFHACAAALRQNPQLSLTAIWRRSVDESCGRLGFLSKSDMRFVLEGGEALAALCGNPSERQAGIYLKRLAVHLEALETEKEKKCKLYNAAGLLCGLLIALLVV